MPETRIHIPSSTEVGRALSGIFAILEGDMRGFSFIDASLASTLRSFLVYFWCWPAQSFLWCSIWRSAPESRPDNIITMAGYFLTGSAFDFLSWLLPALILYPISKPFGFHRQYLLLITVTNWFSLVATYISFFPGAMAYLLPGAKGISAILGLLAYGLTLGLYFRLTRLTLNGEWLLAGMVTLIVLISSLFVSTIAFKTMGL